MKSFIIAISLLFSITVFVTVNSSKTISRIDQMLKIAEALPKTEEAFLHGEYADEDVLALIALWDRHFPVLVYTAGYANTNRCDEAIGALAVHFHNQNGSDFAVALSEFCDGLRRLRTLEGFDWDGIF